VSRSGYYDWSRRKPSARQQRRARIAKAAEQFHLRSHRVYGYRKVHQDICAEAPDLACHCETVRRVMREVGLRSRVKRRFVATTDSGHAKPVAENVLARDFNASGPDEKWSADITYISTREGWLYLAVVLDLWSRRVVGWSMSERIDTTLVQNAMSSALEGRCPTADLLHHSDRGVQYASDDFQRLLAQHGITCSMSRKGDCWDNAPTESFFGKLKAEWLQGTVFETGKAARQAVFEYIEMFYNRVRRHAALGYVSPAEFEACAKGKRAA
jgi:transposase InsO family protein